MRGRHTATRLALLLAAVLAGLGVTNAGIAPTAVATTSTARATGQPVAAAAPAGATPPPGRVVDTVRLGDTAAERAHDVRATGASGVARGSVEAGQLTEPYTARSVRAGGAFTVRLDVARDQPLTLQFREVRPNDEWGVAYGFRVLLDGTLAHVRDPARKDAGGGPYSSFFLESADPAVIGDGQVVVTVEGTSAESAYVGQIWSYADLPGMVAAQGMRTPDRMVFVLGQDHRGEAYFRDRLDYVTSAIHESPEVGRGMAVLDYFANRSPDQLAANYAMWLRLAREYGLPFGIESTSDWEGTPGNVPDGKGGTFGDLKYQQVLWSPQDQTGPEQDVWDGERLDQLLGDRYEPRYGLSVPNIWGNTPWLTWRDPDLNAFYERKADDSLALLGPLAWDLQRTGESDRLLPFSTTLESTYWSKRDGKGVADQAYTGYNGGVERRDLYADYNPSTVAAAKAEGVDLDPVDGLSEQEKHWLYRNQSYPQQLFADIFYAGLPRERITLTAGGPDYPTDQLRHNVHSEVYSRQQEPYWDATHPSIAQGILRHARPGSEYIELDDYTPGGFEHLQRSREFGRIANPNLENSVSGYAPDKTLLLRQTYVNGSRYTSVYNWQGADSPDAAANWVNAFVDDLHPYDVRRDQTPDGELTGRSRVETTFTAGDLRLLNTVEVRVRRTGAAAALRLTVSDEDGRVVTMRHLSGAELPADGWASFAVPVVTLDKGRTYRVTVEQVGQAGQGAVGAPAYDFPTVGGELAIRTGLDMPAERDRSLVLQWRRDAADAIANVTGDLKAGDRPASGQLAAAKVALGRDEYVRAYQLAMKGDALRFPVLYQAHAGSGPSDLGAFPVTLTSGTDANVDVTSYSTGRVLDLTATAYAPGDLTFDVTGFGARPVVELDGTPVPVRRDHAGVTFTIHLPDRAAHHLRVRRS
ncbi:hypothetical protein [Actinopolymorpha pittospori]